jgi:hypothetical chaperone protein
VFQAIEQAKIRLTDAEHTTIDVPELDLSIPITRAEFEPVLVDVLDEVENAVRTVLELAGLEPDQVSTVACTGGSSRIPAVKARLSGIMGRPLVEHMTFTGVAAGLAIAHYCGYSTVSTPNRPSGIASSTKISSRSLLARMPRNQADATAPARK